MVFRSLSCLAAWLAEHNFFPPFELNNGIFFFFLVWGTLSVNSGVTDFSFSLESQNQLSYGIISLYAIKKTACSRILYFANWRVWRSPGPEQPYPNAVPATRSPYRLLSAFQVPESENGGVIFMETKTEKWMLLWNPTLKKGRFGKLCRELEELGSSGQENQPKRQLSGVDGERVPGASAAAILIFCKGKKINQRVFSETDIKWRYSGEGGSSPTHRAAT